MRKNRGPYDAKAMQSAQVYIGLVISMGIFIILSQAIFTLVISVFDLVSFTKARTTAQHLAIEKMETIKNLPYSAVGTVGGIPDGVVLQTETTIRSSLNYTITTTIINIDDFFDDVAPTDTDPADYKKVEVSVTWGGIAASKSPVSMVTYISPSATQTSSGGTLLIHVVDSNGVGVPSAQVAIFADEPNPDVDVDLTTDFSGNLTVPGTPACSTCYEISVTSTAMSTDRTYDSSEVTNPVRPHLTVIDGQVTESTFTIDALSDLTITSTNDRDSGFNLLPNQAFRLRGEKIIGTDAFGSPIYKYDQISTTGSGSTLELTNIEWDNYHIIIPEGGVWDVSGTNAILPISVLPGETVGATFASTSASDHSLLTIFMNNSNSPIASVSATLSGGPTEVTLFSGNGGDPDFGQAFFPDLTESTYTLTATASGYLDYTNSVVVSGYATQQVIMTSQ